MTDKERSEGKVSYFLLNVAGCHHQSRSVNKAARLRYHSPKWSKRNTCRHEHTQRKAIIRLTFNGTIMAIDYVLQMKRRCVPHHTSKWPKWCSHRHKGPEHETRTQGHINCPTHSFINRGVASNITHKDSLLFNAAQGGHRIFGLFLSNFCFPA